MIDNVNKCTGCGACVNICPKDCIELQFNTRGFLKPVIDEKDCIDCKMCETVCPVIHPLEKNNCFEPICYAGWYNDINGRLKSTSGGFFSALSEYVFSNGGIICGVIMDDNFQPYYTTASSMEELSGMRGAKYLHSNTMKIFREVKEILLQGKYVLFSGCPCQVAGLRSFLKDYQPDNLITCEIICHGVPSYFVFKGYQKEIEKKTGQSVTGVNFRSKRFGWETVAASYTLEGKKPKVVHIKAKNNFFLKAFYASLCINDCCVDCNYAKLPRIADFTIGDYWYGVIQNYSKKERKRGISLLLANNKKAVNIAQKLNCNIKTISLLEAVAENVSITSPSKVNVRREEFFSDFEKLGINQLMQKYFPKNLKIIISEFLGKRLVYKLKHVIKKVR